MANSSKSQTNIYDITIKKGKGTILKKVTSNSSKQEELMFTTLRVLKISFRLSHESNISVNSYQKM